MDKDLEFLKELEDEDLKCFVNILTHDENGKKRLTECLSKNSKYQDDPNQCSQYIEEAVEEFRRFGGHTIANLYRGEGVSYKEILCDVCKKLKVDYNQIDSVEEIEDRMMLKLFRNLSPERLEELSKRFDISLNTINQAISTQSSTITQFLGFLGMQEREKVSVSMLRTVFGGFVPTSLWFLWDMANPNEKVIVPAVIQIAYLRQLHAYRQQEKERKKVMEKMENISMQENGGEDLQKIKQIFTEEMLQKLMKKKLHLLIVGGTGVGKSSTINAMFEMDRAKVGTSFTPETMDVREYDLGNLIIYDSPGLGDSTEDDEKHLKKIKDYLSRKDEKGEALIDMVLVILDAKTRDFGSAYKAIGEVLPLLGDKERILVALNKCDEAGGRGKAFDYENNRPSEELKKFLEEQKKEVQERLKKELGEKIEVVYYSAGAIVDGKQDKSYNLLKLFYHIAEHTPKKKRFIYTLNQSSNKANFESNDGKLNYQKETEKGFLESLFDNVGEFVDNVVDVAKKIADLATVVEPCIVWLKDWWFRKKWRL